MDYSTVSKLNPALIYASITGYGQTGPYSNRAGYDVMVEAEMGLMHITGARDGPPVKVGVAVTDLTTGLYTSNAIMAALLGRIKSGKGQHIDAALSDCQVATLANIASSALISGKKDSGRWGTSHPSIVPYKAFKTSDGDILLGGGNDRLYGVLCTKIGKPEWILDDRFKTNALRVQHRDILEDLIEGETKKKSTKEWLDILDGCGMPYSAINDIQTTLNHEHVLARGMVQEVEHPVCGPIKLVNTPVKYSSATPGIRTPPPTLGQHTDEILRETLGMSDWEMENLRKPAGAADAPNGPPNLVSSSSAAPNHTTSGAQLISKSSTTPAPPAWPSQTLSTPYNGPPVGLAQFSAATAEILNRIRANPGNTAGTPAFEAKRAEVLQSYRTSDKLPTPPPITNTGRRGRGGKAVAPSQLKTEVAASPTSVNTPTSARGSGRGRGRGRGRGGGGRGGKRKRSESVDDSDNDSEISSSYTPLPTRTKSGRNVNKPVAFVPTLPEPTPAVKRRRTAKTILAAQCKTCHRGTDPGNNRIVFCDACNTAYHQYCHDPPIDSEVVTVLEKEWLCGPCERSKQNVIEGTDGLVGGDGLSIDEVNKPRSTNTNDDEFDDGYDTDPPAHYPKAGNGLARTLRPEIEDLPWLVDDNFEVFSHGWKGDGSGVGADGELEGV
ncbi:CoA-transferase family III domain-containing protein [Dendryphion nanum]|uniref:CoA-transferase family III domain-containing protein n=1 Tax=Dendryphion nanum TaxID=256645 RepID=A0A9P9IX48_9PLEO|nr:CoA-transferase family III domain-containing protein [Dendryphion nanum]